MMKVNSGVVSEGLDISYFQGDINFNTMKSKGISFVIIRAGYGTSTVDKRFITYINGALKAGIRVGVYWFIYATDVASAKNNAKKLVETIAPYKDYITCGVWADFEYDSDKYAGYKLNAYSRSAIVEAFNSYLTDAGYEVGIYSNQDYIKSGKFTAALVAKYPLWFAKYTSSMGSYANKGKDNLPYLWQYTSSGNGKLYGCSSTNLDMDHGYFTVETVKVDTTPSDAVTTSPKTIKASDNPYITPTRLLKYVSGKSMLRGDDVKWVQWHLWRFGLLVDKKGVPDSTQIDGYFGKNTDTAVREAQKRLSLTIDGKVGPATRTMFTKV